MRLANRVLAALLILALACAGALLIIEVTADRLSTGPPWSTGTLRTPGPRAPPGPPAASGWPRYPDPARAVLLLAELKPPRVARLAADPAGPARRMDTA